MRRAAGWLLITCSGLLSGVFLTADLAAGGTLLIPALLSAGVGIALVRNGRSRSKFVLQSEILRLAEEQHGRITVLEAAAAFGIPVEEAKGVLEAFVISGVADLEVSESGTVIYSFAELQRPEEKSRTKGLLE